VETKLIQLTLSEREAEALDGALGIASVMLARMHPARALIVGSSLTTVLAFDDEEVAEMLECEMANACGVPCLRHHGKQADKKHYAAAEHETVELLKRLGIKIHEFCKDYRNEKIALYPDRQEE